MRNAGYDNSIVNIAEFSFRGSETRSFTKAPGNLKGR
jgi:hypothetical protein